MIWQLHGRTRENKPKKICFAPEMDCDLQLFYIVKKYLLNIDLKITGFY